MLKWNLSILVIIFLLINIFVSSEFIIYNRRCKIGIHKIDKAAKRLSELQVQRVIDYPNRAASKPVVKPELQLKYQYNDYYFIKFIDSGGSGEVYLVQDAQTQKPRIYKRFYHEKLEQFRRQNYIMNLLNYQINWAKDCGRKRCTPDSKNYSSIAIYPYKQSIVLRKLQFDADQCALLFYKILKQLDKAHKHGIIHHDIKMGNILINSIHDNFKFFQVQLIDWNLSTFYFKGYEFNGRKGTTCYYSPEELLKSIHNTPATDIWSLAVVMIVYITDSKPFKYNCKDDNLKSIVSLIGGQKIIELAKKYRYNVKQKIQFLNYVQENPKQFMPQPLQTMKFKKNKDFLVKNQHLMDVFKRMLQADAQKRATAQELMNMKYFENITRLPLKYEYYNKKHKNQLPDQDKQIRIRDNKQEQRIKTKDQQKVQAQQYNITALSNQQKK